ncbi:unnamed protein product [Ambrosiozyma monospora]|uniref:Unnamed protein product n=1 Tax=Ambrosiozyma monospora TaxID=43982 RepID=A0A9W6Z8Z1_AMBMO|nr:unnamed protein product [Ambrosiozyma monospora]
MDFNYRDTSFKNQLFDLFNDNFAQYFAYSHSKLDQIRAWQFPNPDPSKQLLLCVIFAYSCAYDNRYAKAAKLLLNEADAMVLATYRNNMNEHVLHALLIRSCYEVGRGHDSNSWYYNAMVCSQAQYLGLHLREGTRQGDLPASTSSTTSTPNVLVNTSPSNIALFWAIFFQDRSITTVLGRSCLIPYFRMTVPFYTSRLNLRLCGNDPNLLDSYMTEITFSLHSELWYSHDRITQQIYSAKADFLHKSHRLLLLRQGLSTLQTLHSSFPDEIKLKRNTSDKRVLLLHLSYYTVLTLLHRSYLVQNPKRILELIMNHCDSASKLTKQFSELHGFENAPYFSGYLLFQCAMFDLFLLALNDPSMHESAHIRFSIFITALSEYSKSWRRGIKDLRVLTSLAKKWKLGVSILEEINSMTSKGGNASTPTSQSPDESVQSENEGSGLSPYQKIFEETMNIYFGRANTVDSDVHWLNQTFGTSAATGTATNAAAAPATSHNPAGSDAVLGNIGCGNIGPCHTGVSGPSGSLGTNTASYVSMTPVPTPDIDYAFNVLNCSHFDFSN